MRSMKASATAGSSANISRSESSSSSASSSLYGSRRWQMRSSSKMARSASRQGLTLLHFSTQLKRFLWDRGCIEGLCRVVLFRRYKGFLGGIKGCPGGTLCQKQLRLS